MKLIFTQLISLFFLGCATCKGNVNFEVHRNIKYSEERLLRGDLYLPNRPDARVPVVILVHGGGFKSGNKKRMWMVAEALASNGIAAFSINYRLTPQFTYSDPVEDIQSAHQFLVAKQEKFKIDTSRLGLWGYSAGGYLVSFYALTGNKTQIVSRPIKAVVSGGAPYDLTATDEARHFETFIGKDIVKLKVASPIQHISKKSPSFFIYHASEGSLVDPKQVAIFEEELNVAGVKAEKYMVPFWGHTLTFYMSREANKRAVKFILETL